MSIDKLLENDRTHWQWYRSFFNIIILRYLVTWFAIVPIVSKMIAGLEPSLKIQDVVEVQLLNDATLPFNLQILWLSSLLFVIALFLYQMFCPSFIKTYSNFADYLQHHHSPRWIVWESIKVLNDKSEIEKLFIRLNTKGYLTEYNGEFSVNEVRVEKHQTAAYFRYGVRVYRLALPLLKMGSENDLDKDETIVAEKEIFWEIFGRFSSSKKYLRFAIIILLVMSGLLFLFTLCEHIWQGLEYFI